MGDDTEDTRSIEDRLSEARASGYDKGYREGSAYTKKETQRKVLRTFERIGEDSDNNQILTAVAALRVAWEL